MDKTEQFIKMSDCPEIQEQWRKFACIEERLVWADKTSKDSHANLWLPRQDQIQEMMDLKTTWCKAYWLYNFAEIHRNPNESFPFKSMEQLWIAFYMWEKHEKIWSSKEEKWVKK